MRQDYLRALVWLTAVQAVVTLLAGLNLVVPITAAATGWGPFVRWREIFALLFITPASGGLMVVAMWVLERGRTDAGAPFFCLAFAICLVAVSMGVHEPINQLHRAGTGRLGQSLFFWDEVFSHAVFFTGYAGVSMALIWSQVRNPLVQPMGPAATLVFLACGVISGAGIFFSLVRAPEIRVDLAVIAAVIVLAEVLRRGRAFRVVPLSIALEASYVLALAGLLLREAPWAF